MNRKAFYISTLLLVILLTGVVFDDGYAGISTREVREGDGHSKAFSQSKNTATFSGLVSGSLQGRIRVGGNNIVITEQTRIYKTGKGVIKLGTFVVDTPIHAVCVMKKNTAFARFVIVSDRRTPNTEGVAGELDPNEPL